MANKACLEEGTVGVGDMSGFEISIRARLNQSDANLFLDTILSYRRVGHIDLRAESAATFVVIF
jgi:hypothetical protein